MLASASQISCSSASGFGSEHWSSSSELLSANNNYSQCDTNRHRRQQKAHTRQNRLHHPLLVQARQPQLHLRLLRSRQIESVSLRFGLFLRDYRCLELAFASVVCTCALFNSELLPLSPC